MLDPSLFSHFANLLFLSAYLVKSMIWLRGLSIVALLSNIGFNWFKTDEPLWTPIGWGTFSILVNMIQIGILLRERSGLHFSEAEREMFDTIFAGLNPVEYMKLLRAGKWTDVPADEDLIHRGEPVERLVLLYNGQVAVDRGDGEVLQLNDGSFLGEMAFVSGETASADVHAETPLKLFVWDFDKLKKLFEINPALSARFQGVIGRDLATKLRG